MKLSNFEIDHRARKCLQNSLPDNWSLNPPTDDLGIDYWVQITESGNPTGLSFFVQLKGTTANEPKYNLRTDRLAQYLMVSLPVLFVICLISEKDQNEDLAYYCWINESLIKELSGESAYYDFWKSNKTVTINISNSFNLDKSIAEQTLLPYIENYYKRHSIYEKEYYRLFFECMPFSKIISNFDQFFLDQKVEIGGNDIEKIKGLLLAGHMAQRDMKHWDAIGYFTEAQSIYPTPIVLLSLSYSYMSLNNPESALDAAEQAIGLEPNNAFAWSNKGTALFQLGRFMEAFECHEKATQLMPEEALLWTNAAATLEYLGTEIHLDKKDELLNRALNFYERARDLKPNDSFILSEMGLVLSKLYNFRRAIIILEDAIRIDYNNHVARRRLARAYVMTVQHKEALEQIEWLFNRDLLPSNMVKTKEWLESMLK